MMRPVTHLATESRVLIGSLEQHVLNIRCAFPAVPLLFKVAEHFTSWSLQQTQLLQLTFQSCSSS